jgi:hypothetical protein
MTQRTDLELSHGTSLHALNLVRSLPAVRRGGGASARQSDCVPNRSFWRAGAAGQSGGQRYGCVLLGAGQMGQVCFRYPMSQNIHS